MTEIENWIKDVEERILNAVEKAPEPRPFRLYLSKAWFRHLPKPKWYRYWFRCSRLKWMKRRNRHVVFGTKFAMESGITLVQNQRSEE